jgi:hypothetical protein
LRDGRVVHRLRSLFLDENERGLRPGWRFVLFLTLYLVAGDVLNRLLLRIHFPDRTFTWSGLLLNYLVDFAFVAALLGSCLE